jgi:Beta-lactamase enzyme family
VLRKIVFIVSFVAVVTFLVSNGAFAADSGLGSPSSSVVQTAVDRWAAVQNPALELGVSVQEVGGYGRSASVAPHTFFSTASTYKIWVGWRIMAMVDAGQLAFGSVTGDMRAMIVDSNNDSAIALGRIVGWDNLTAAAKSIGANETCFVSLSCPGAVSRGWYGNANFTSPADTTLLTGKLFAGTLLKPDSNAYLLGLLSDQRAISNKAGAVGGPGLQGIRDTGAVVMDKPGWLAAPDYQTIGDVGIVSLPDNVTYLISVYMMRSNGGLDMGLFQKIDDLNRAVASAMKRPIIDLQGTPVPTETLGFTPISPYRVWDSRGQAPATERTVHLNVPAGTRAVSVNFTVTDSLGAGFGVVWPCGPQPNSSSVNFAARDTRAAGTIVALDASGNVCLSTSVPADTILDVTGLFSSGGNGLTAGQQRLLDTRNTTKVAPGAPVFVPILSPAVVLNLTATGEEGPGFVTAWPLGAGETCVTSPVPNVSSLNFVADRNVANIAQLAAPLGVCLAATTRTHVIVDKMGTWGASGLRLRLGTPTRLADTRSGFGTWPGIYSPSDILTLRTSFLSNAVPEAKAVFGSLVAVSPWQAGFASVVSCGSAANVSTLNFTAGQTVANGALVPLVNGNACVTGSADSQYVFDVTGWLV